MGLLRDETTRIQVTLAARTLVGRSHGCALHIADARISAEHAVISFSGGQWSVRDLGSRNGTWIDGRRLDVAERAPLAVGSRVAFAGDEHAWTVIDASAPAAQARCLADDALRTADEGLLALPDADHVELTVYRAAEGQWLAEGDDGDLRVVRDADLVVAGGRTWRLHLPHALAPTVATTELGELGMRFRVSPDEEHVEVTVVERGSERTLRPRSHHYLLLTLARERLADDGRGEAERGWLTEERVADMLRLDRQTVKVQIYRARQELAELGLPDAARVVERRAGTGQMRLGVADLAVQVG